MSENLDVVCAEYGRKIAQKDVDERTLNNALGVLEEQGVYAFFLFLAANEKEKIKQPCIEFLKNIPSKPPLLEMKNDKPDLWKGLKALAEDLDRLLFARQLLRQVLVYARFHLKAKGGEG